jgi:hypothetical protein
MTRPCQPGPLVRRTDEGFFDSAGAPLLVVPDAEAMAPFLITVVSDADLWMYVSSAGGLTCGRGRAERCLFPYETDDRLHEASGRVGPVTLLRVRQGTAAPRLWQPLSPEPGHEVRRHLYKNPLGTRLIFEEVNSDCGLTFRYQWAASTAHGFVRSAELVLSSDAPGPVEVELLDGLLALMPAGVDLTTQQRASALVDAYRRAALDAAAPHLATYELSALIVDRAEPAESLSCNLAFGVGLPGARVLLDPRQLRAFRRGEPLVAEPRVVGRPAAYLLASTLRLEPGASQGWDISADVDLSAAEVVRRRKLACDPEARRILAEGVASSEAGLLARIASADGVQATGDAVEDAHHLANVLFNCMRGGVFVDGYRAPAADVRSFVAARSRRVAARHAARLEALPDPVDCVALVADARASGDPDLERLALEYLPLTFSRRHGDPSRPWNQFDIRVRGRDGAPVLYYQGNWRDIFQNWEALALSFPAFLPHFVAKFVNASTVDGFNPYRITRDGVDWEVPDPAEPWSNIGYWGDHQIVYLTRLLELTEAFWPGRLAEGLDAPIYTFADVPYRLRSYAELVADPRDTIVFDEAGEQEVLRRVAAEGADGRLLTGEDGAPVRVTLIEKLLIPILAKLSNLVPDGGIWMNTQRPEWNDANNALAGHGLSMVTLYQLRRHLTVCRRLLAGRAGDRVRISLEVGRWMDAVAEVLGAHAGLLSSPRVGDGPRREVMDALGAAFDAYRRQVYAEGLTPGTARPLHEVEALLALAGQHLDHAIRANRRPDGLYHAYNLLYLGPDTAAVGPLYEMLEGQVAVLSAGILSPREAVQVLDALFASPMYREDQRSFMLYPERSLPGLVDKNVIPPERVAACPLLARLGDAGTGAVVERDPEGAYRFAAGLRNAGDLARALDALGPEWAPLLEAGRAGALEAWEAVFAHHAFTGRSGTMYGYEGLGCIYWHMVSKLLLAVQENLRWAEAEGAPRAVRAALLAHYRRIRAGLGPAKTPAEYGAFPTDPYSHTPRHAGARQPGMTGQVKEELLTRLGELGVRVEGGRLVFGPGLLGSSGGGEGGRRFTVAGTEVRWARGGDAPRLVVHPVEGAPVTLEGGALDVAWSAAVFLRGGTIRHLEVTAPRVDNPVIGE